MVSISIHVVAGLGVELVFNLEKLCSGHHQCRLRLRFNFLGKKESCVTFDTIPTCIYM